MCGTHLGCRVVQVELAALGLSTSFQQLRVADLGDEVWQGVRNKYWRFPTYFLPVVRHAAAAGSSGGGADAAAAEDKQGDEQGGAVATAAT